MRFLLNLLSLTVLAAETVISPLPNDNVTVSFAKPTVSFGFLATYTPIPAPLPSPVTLQPEPAAPTPVLLPPLSKKSYTIALIGDSMIDTLGFDLPHLAAALKKLYPTTQFNLLNYGMGA